MANRCGNSGNSETLFYFFLCSKVTTDGDCSHEIKSYFLLGQRVITNLDSILKIREITLSISQTIVFPVVMYGYKSRTIKKHEQWRMDAFELWWWRILSRVPWTAGRSNQSILLVFWFIIFSSHLLFSFFHHFKFNFVSFFFSSRHF